MNILNGTMNPIETPDQYGAASKFHFDDPNKWHTEHDVPLLDEHEMTDEQGNPIAYVDKNALEEIAANNNKRVIETGDPATLILGHTSDDPRAPEKPAKGFVVNYKVKPFKRDPKTGQVIYAIHGDYKVRPRNAHLIEEFPRRSVELWWNRKELDPVAMLGGTTPERDLSVVIRKARINNVGFNQARHHNTITKSSPGKSGAESPDDDFVIHFRKHGEWTVERYMIDDVARFAKKKKLPPVPTTEEELHTQRGNTDNSFLDANTASEYALERQHGTTIEHGHRRGSATSIERNLTHASNNTYRHNHAEAVIYHERLVKKHLQQAGRTRNNPEVSRLHKEAAKAHQDAAHAHSAAHRAQIEHNYSGLDENDKPVKKSRTTTKEGAMPRVPKRYNAQCDLPRDMEDKLEYERDDESPDGMVDSDGEDHEQSEDPMVAKLLASKPIQDMMSKIDTIMQALQDQAPGMGDEGDGMGMENGPGPSDQGGPMDGQSPAQMAGPGQMPNQGPEDESSMQPEMDERDMHGESPVRFDSTGLPGPMNTNIPGMQKGRRVPPTVSYSRKDKPMPQPTRTSNDVIKLQRQVDKLVQQNESLRFMYARKEAEGVVNQLEQEGILFGDSPDEAAKVKAEEVEFLAMLGEEDQAYHVNEVIRKRYRRKAADPVHPAYPGVARYARRPDGEGESDEDNYAPSTPAEASAFSDLQTLRGMSRGDAIKYMRKRNRS